MKGPVKMSSDGDDNEDYFDDDGYDDDGFGQDDIMDNSEPPAPQLLP